jgi:primase-polymerase (primpol)-like protein
MRTTAIDVVEIDVDKIPRDLRNRRAWINWRKERQGKRVAKPPYDPQSGRLASSSNPTTWASFDEALAAFENADYDGIGLQLGPPFVGIDLDHCRDPETGVINDDATAIIGDLNSYTEVSPSGRGVHILVIGILPRGGRRTKSIELYDRDRYFTVTGRHVTGTPLTIEARNPQLTALHKRLFSAVEPPRAVEPVATQSQASKKSHASASLADEELLTKMKAANNGSWFERLWDGDWQDEYPSQSEADLAMCANLAFWTGKDPGRMDSLFRQSKLFRPKWDEQRGSRTYGEATIAAARSRVHGTWDPPPAPVETGEGRRT